MSIVKNIFQKFFYVIVVVCIGYIVVVSSIDEIFISKDELADKEYENRNSRQNFWDGKYDCIVECKSISCSVVNVLIQERNNYFPYSEIMIDHDSIQYLVLKNDTIFKSEMKNPIVTNGESFTIETKNNKEYDIIVSR